MNSARRLPGFTLVELMVATAVLSVMVVFLIQVLNHTSVAWTRGQAQAERRQSARAVGDAIAQELQAALMPLDPADQKSLQFVLNSPSVPARYGYADTIFWQAPIATNRHYGDVAEVGYFLKWDQTRPGNPRPLLCRFFVNPSDTTNYAILQKPDEWLVSDLLGRRDILERVAPANNLGTNGYAGLFAENVVGFWVRCYGKDGVAVASYDSRQKMTLPRTVKVFLVLVGPQSLPRLTRIPDYTRAGSGPEPNLEAFIAALPAGVRETARPYITEVRLQNAL
jgi:prepilin-type N-terminal cleavage/methylation domain-containing protein